ncbi:Orotate phosphoribosyltransferase [bioreactor metagenome]|uniref:orotate phosphoribosyltransferase n=1 Tax=bioreactor metagenome TaxID=1076179 RepID=A0A645F9X6_9ZZZZ
MLEGHFLLTSGRHSDKYMQCARLFENIKYSELLCSELASRFRDKKIDMTIGPALGGVIIAYETARALGVKNIFAERQDSVMTIRRGFEIPKGTRVLVLEDVVTTGGSVQEVIDVVRAHGGEVVGVGVIVDRSAGKVDFGVPLESIISMEVVSYAADECPLCKLGTPAVKPGSRGIK